MKHTVLQRVVLGMDLDSQPGEDFTAEIAAQQALSGELRVRVLMGSPVTNCADRHAHAFMAEDQTVFLLRFRGILCLLAAG